MNIILSWSNYSFQLKYRCIHHWEIFIWMIFPLILNLHFHLHHLVILLILSYTTTSSSDWLRFHFIQSKWCNPIFDQVFKHFFFLYQIGMIASHVIDLSSDGFHFLNLFQRIFFFDIYIPCFNVNWQSSKWWSKIFKCDICEKYNFWYLYPIFWNLDIETSFVSIFFNAILKLHSAFLIMKVFLRTEIFVNVFLIHIWFNWDFCFTLFNFIFFIFEYHAIFLIILVSNFGLFGICFAIFSFFIWINYFGII
jgi:hypothetical protein